LSLLENVSVFDEEMRPMRAADARGEEIFHDVPQVISRKTKRRGPRGGPRLPFLTVAGGFGGSGDDQSCLVHGGKRCRGEKRDGRYDCD